MAKYLLYDEVISSLDKIYNDLYAEKDYGYAEELAENQGARDAIKYAIDEIKELIPDIIDDTVVGKWLENHDWINCSICGFDVKDEYYEKRFTYKNCPHCGARLIQ